jgi:hypothetical protein
MVRSVSVPGPKTLCYPRPRVQHITWLLPTVLCQHTEIDAVVFDVRFHDIRNGSLERLKQDFEELIGSLLDIKNILKFLALCPCWVEVVNI